MWISWNGIIVTEVQIIIITKYNEAGKETISLLNGIIHISLALFKALCPFPLNIINKTAQIQNVI